MSSPFKRTPKIRDDLHRYAAIEMEKNTVIPNLSRLLEADSYLEPFRGELEYRYTQFQKRMRQIQSCEGSLEEFSLGYKQFGLHQVDGGMLCREWAPGASAVHLVGDFNYWNRTECPLTRNEYGVWEYFLPDNTDGTPRIKHGTKYKLNISSDNGSEDHISPWARFVIQNKDTKLFESVFWDPPQKYSWKHPRPPTPKTLRIYECHVGIASEEYGVASYTHFKEKVIPHIVYLGYNCVQLMAIMEHAYYASFGYQVTSFFAPSSRFGLPEELKELIDACHGNNLCVFLDVVHGHASPNVLDGLNKFDGTLACYFHEGSRGEHSLWNSRLFDYTQLEVLRFLLSNLRYYYEEFRFDGFRFDGATSMLYHHHGIGTGFSGDYGEYFGLHVDIESITYLQLANHLLHSNTANAITIAEDVSGMPGLCRPVDEGGIGFDYRLNMAIPDKWIELLKHVTDDNWSMGALVHNMVNRRYSEKSIAYAESHDQALVGDKTMAFWLMDKDMYTNMSVMTERNMVIDRGMALHKMIRLLTIGLGGEAYLNFMGNEFGHPEWLDFPREGNNFSYQYARRQWHLVHDSLLRYRFLNEFDRAMMTLERQFLFLSSNNQYISSAHEEDKVIVFEKGSLLWVFNLHPTQAYTDYRVGVNAPGVYKIVLDTDDTAFDGHGRIQHGCEFFTEPRPFNKRLHSLQVYIPPRVAIILALQPEP